MRAALVFCILLAGCVLPGSAPPVVLGPPTPTDPTAPPVTDAPIAFSGIVHDAVTGDIIPGALVRLDLSQSQPCLRPGIGWASWELPVGANGAFGPQEVPRPKSNDVAFFLHVGAPGYAENVTPIGPTGKLALSFDVALHPKANLTGTAPPGTLIALDWPGSPRIALAGADGRFAFEGVRAFESDLVAGTDAPWIVTVAPDASLVVPDPPARGWTVEGTLKGPGGAGLSADVVAFNGTRLVGVARSSDTGAFAMPLPREVGSYQVQARTADGHYGATKRIELAGPPALRETLVATARC